jgi:hypothetical protein
MSCTECDAATSGAGSGLAAKLSQMAGGGAFWAWWCLLGAWVDLVLCSKTPLEGV